MCHQGTDLVAFTLTSHPQHSAGCTERFMLTPHISRLIFAYAYTKEEPLVLHSRGQGLRVQGRRRREGLRVRGIRAQRREPSEAHRDALRGTPAHQAHLLVRRGRIRRTPPLRRQARARRKVHARRLRRHGPLGGRPPLRRRREDFSAKHAFRVSADTVREIVGLHYDAIRDFPKDESHAKEDAGGAAPLVCVMADGTGIPLRKECLEGAKGKDGRAKTREAKAAAIFRASTTSDSASSSQECSGR